MSSSDWLNVSDPGNPTLTGTFDNTQADDLFGMSHCRLTETWQYVTGIECAFTVLLDVAAYSQGTQFTLTGTFDTSGAIRWLHIRHTSFCHDNVG